MVRHIHRAVIAGVLALLILALFSGSGATLAAGPNGYTYVWQNPVGTGELLYSTSAASATAVWSVGAYGAILYWNGTTLTKQASGTTNNLYSVYAQDATHVWAVGEKGTILFYNGTTWAPQGTGVTTYDLIGVSAAATNRVWAVGGYDGFKNAVILYYNGTTWTVQLSQATGGFTDVYAYDATHVWAVSIWTWFYNGTTWTKVNDGNSSTGIDPYQISGYSTTNLWAVGWSGKVLNSTNAGTTWNAAPATPNTGTPYGTLWPSSISALDATHIYAVGWGGSIALYNGTTWATQASGTTKDLYDVDIFGAASIFAGGDTKFISYNTPTWTALTGGTTSNLYQVWGYDANNLWTVGTNVATYGNIQSTTSGGNIWSTQSSGTTSTLYGVANVDKTHVWVAGPGVLFWNGSTWSTQLSSSQTYYSICAAGANAVYVGAGNGQVSYYNGSTWTAQNTGVSSGIWAISAPDATHAWACSNTGTIIYTSNSGTTWSKQTSNTSTNIDWVTALNSTTAWAFGDGGLILYTNNAGATWQPQTSGTTQNLYGGFALNGTHVWAVGTGGTILFYNGTSWAPQTSPTTNTLWAVYAQDANDAWIVGDAGTIIFADPPYIKACAPGWANPGDTVDVEVIGGYTNFQASTPTLSFGAGVSVVPGSVNVVDNTHILAQVQVDPGAALGPRDVNATTVGETPIPLAGGFVVGARPTIASISKASAPRGWTGDVDVTGSQTSFSPASRATFGSGVTVNNVTYSDIYRVTANITVGASAAPGPRSVNVTTGSETPAPLADAFTVATPPSVTGVSPGAGPTGSQVTVSGSGFGSSQETSTVTFNGTPATVASGHWADGVITTTVPSGATTGPVGVTTAEGTSNTDKVFTVGVAAPTISSCNPASATQGQTLNVDITGMDTNFLSGSSQATFSNSGITVNSTTVTDTTHATANITNAPDAATGPRDVNVITGTETPAPLAGGFTVNKYVPPTPAITSVSPASGPPGTTVTIDGSNFGSSRGTGAGKTGGSASCVSFNGVQATQYPEWSDTRIQAVVPDGATPGPVTVVTALGGTSNGKTFTVASTTFYFAEGYTGANFAEYLCLGNPNSAAATANVTYLFSDGTTKPASYNVPATGRTTVNVNSEVGPDKEVSIQVLSDTANLVAERPIYFNYNGVWTGGSDAVGAKAPNTDWYFAEGNTLPGFDQYVTVLNPGDATANLTFHYMVEGAGEKDVKGSVGAHSRATFKTRDQIGSNKNASLYLSSDRNVVAERPMYFNYQGLASNNWTGGHDVVGTNSPQKQWYLAEGTTRGGLEEWLCLENPGSSDITVNATYQLGSGQGAPINKSYTVPAKQRFTVSVNREIGPEKDDSVQLTSTGSFIAERPMYFNYQGVWTGGSDVLGANSSVTTWFFAEGTTRDNFSEWLCLQNPGSADAHVNITYYTASGQANSKPWTVSANSRLTVNVNQDAGANQDISAKVSSDNPIIVERPMYFNYNGWTGGHDVVGF